MTRRIFLLAVVGPLAVTPVQGQRLDLDGSFGYGSDAWRASLSSQWRLSVGSRLALGAGARLTYYAGEAGEYRNQGATAIALPATLEIDPSVWGLNLMVSGQVRLIRRLIAGANIDVAGIAGGPDRSAGGASLEPAPWSLLLYGDDDRGSLNSEFFLGYDLDDRFQLRGGVSHYVVGYRASDGTTDTRYLRFDTVPFLALRWVP